MTNDSSNDSQILYELIDISETGECYEADQIKKYEQNIFFFNSSIQC